MKPDIIGSFPTNSHIIALIFSLMMGGNEKNKKEK